MDDQKIKNIPRIAWPRRSPINKGTNINKYAIRFIQPAAHRVPWLTQGAFLALHRDTPWLTFPVCKFHPICYCQNWLFKSQPDAVLSGPVWVPGFLDTIFHSPGASILHSFRTGHRERNPRFTEEVCKAMSIWRKSCFTIGPPEIKAWHKRSLPSDQLEDSKRQKIFIHNYCLLRGLQTQAVKAAELEALPNSHIENKLSAW